MTAKRGLFCITVVLLILVMSSVAGAGMLLEVDGNALGAAVVVENGRSYLPLRAVVEMVGAEINWDNQSKTAYISKGHTVLAFSEGKAEYLVNGKVHVMDVVPLIVDGRLYVPIRFAAESLGYRVAYDEDAKTIRLTSVEPAFTADVAWSVSNGGRVKFLLTVKNPGSVPVEVVLPGGQDFDMLVLKEGKVIYRWSEGKAFTMALRFITYASGEEKQFTWEWMPPSAGTYEIEVFYMGISRDEPVVTKTLVVDWEPSA